MHAAYGNCQAPLRASVIRMIFRDREIREWVKAPIVTVKSGSGTWTMRKVRVMTGGRWGPLTSLPLLPLWETRTPFPAATLLDPTVTPLRRPITVAVVGAGCLHVAAMDNLGERMEVIAYKRKKVMSVTSRPLLPPLSADCLFLIWYCLPAFSSFQFMLL